MASLSHLDQGQQHVGVQRLGAAGDVGKRSECTRGHSCPAELQKVSSNQGWGRYIQNVTKLSYFTKYLQDKLRYYYGMN